MLEILKNYHQISGRLHTSAQPTSEQFKLIKKSGVEVVINLALINSPNAIENEAQLVVENNMDYVHIPVDFKKPTNAELESFFNIMNQFINKKILIHCAYNWRVSCFVYLYRVLENNISDEQAKNDMLKVWEPDKTWQSFIDTIFQRKIKKDKDT